MKHHIQRITILLISVFVFEGLNAQADSLKNLPNLLLPRFTNSMVVMKSGEKRRAVLNYNLVDQEMVFMQKDQYFVLDDPHLIDTIYMANRTFIPQEKGFYEFAVPGPVALFIQHKAYAESVGVPTGYGARSQTTSYNYVKTIFGGNGAINLKFPAEFRIVDDTEYWVRKEGVMQNFDSKRQFLKIFPEKEKELNQFIGKNKVSFDDYRTVIRLVEHCNEIM
ncbi:MAG TPA: hypothetical protein PLV06_12895 [Bacteroidales bacterium]|nr:hypothetical protein [Bacteroidales bacterium]HPF02912.1 hypothetical protein [Bacteroidales bacterium]HPJ60094.1 hypothetical protein [Bacteroidales bacterium]HPR13278.1 hypothetical protein [Bacteroidales bacterium]HRW85565.1 hypothetical protein [Bacteroidales bacterium]